MTATTAADWLAPQRAALITARRNYWPTEAGEFGD